MGKRWEQTWKVNPLHIRPFIISPVNPRPEDNNNKPKRKRK
jgi:hypothetical protein